MSAPDTGTSQPKKQFIGMTVGALVTGVAAVLAISYWIVESYVHSRSQGTSFSNELFTSNENVVVARIIFLGILLLCGALFIAVVRTAHRRWERLTRENDIKRIAIMENIHELIVLHDRNLTAVWANKAAGDSVGLPPESIVGKHCYELWHQRSEPCVVCPVLRAMETGEPQQNDVFTPDGRAFFIRGYPIHDEKGAVTGAVELTLDITDRRRAEDALALEKERLAITLASIADGVIVTDTRGTVTFMNQAAQHLTGWKGSEALGRDLGLVLALVDERSKMPCASPLDAVMRTGSPASLPENAILLSRGGPERFIADSGAPIRDAGGMIVGMILVFRDITARRRLEKEILKSQKLESLGLVAGGIAHDFNNILTAIIANASLAQLSIGTEDKTRIVLADIEKAATRARSLTQQLLTFSKGGAPLKKVTALGDVVQDTVRFALSGANVSCTFKIAPDLWPVEADADQISHAVNNIVINAREAMQEGGTISVTAENADVADGESLRIPPQKYVKISIQDQGIGIPREDLIKIFDPYFTRKEGYHSGLGLAVAFSVITKHGGYIFADSVPDVATTFTMYLPAAASGARTEGHGPRKVYGTRGQGRILVMDDDEMIRDVLGKILTRFGYEAEFAADGMEALEKYRTAMTSPSPFDAVIMDLTITGGMGGKQAIDILRLVDPNARAIVSSGYSDDPVMSDYKKYGFDGVIAKPYRAEELSELLGRILAAKKPSRERSGFPRTEI